MKCPECKSNNISNNFTINCNDCDEIIYLEHSKLEADRDKWKAKAKYFHTTLSLLSCHPCNTCEIRDTLEGSCICISCVKKDYANWKFDINHFNLED